MSVALAPLAQGVGESPNALVLAINDRLRRISQALPDVVAPTASGGPVTATAPALGGYGFTEAQAAGILTLLNNIQAALLARGIVT